MSCSRSLHLHRERLKRLSRERRAKQKSLRQVEKELSAIAFPRPREQNRLKYLGAYTQAEALVSPRDYGKTEEKATGIRQQEEGNRGNGQQSQRYQQQAGNEAPRDKHVHSHTGGGVYVRRRGGLHATRRARAAGRETLPATSPQPSFISPSPQGIPETSTSYGPGSRASTANAWASPWRAGNTHEGDNSDRGPNIFLEGTTAGLPCPPSSPTL